MNKAFIIGNLTRDPELRQVNTSAGQVNVCDFTVAVNRRNGQNTETDFFRVTAWRGLGENCAKYLAKGRKVAVHGPVSCRSYTKSDGTAAASLEITAEDVEFLTPKGEAPASAPASAPSPQPKAEQQRIDHNTGFAQVEDELPF